jgi:hypothetical protein
VQFGVQLRARYQHIEAGFDEGGGNPMNNSVYFESAVSDDDRRRAIFDGQLFVYGRREPIRQLAEFARSLIVEAFAPLDPETAQHEMEVGRFAAILGELKPRFIHHAESKRLVSAILEDLGCDPSLTYFDVPRLRSSTSEGYLTTGIAYAWHPHRDTWYSAPRCQINFWMPVFDIESDNAMAFHPSHWNKPVANDSEHYNYYAWNQAYRGPSVAKLIGEDPRPLPKATESVAGDPQLRLIFPTGGVLIFSGAQMHSSVPNTTGKTRFSIDFRTVHLDDAVNLRGAPLCDEACTGTTIRDFLRCTDLSRLPTEVVAKYDDGTLGKGVAIYTPR